jgi:hypothetical protein
MPGVDSSLTSRERKALETMWLCPYEFELLGKFSTGIGRGTLDGLVAKGLAEVGPSPRQPGQTGWRITPEGRGSQGWR